MELAPSTAPRSFCLSPPLKGGCTAERPTSPDSACEEHDGCSPDDLSEEGAKDHSTSLKDMMSKRRLGEAILGKGLAGQDSDVDSGIVTCRKPGERIGSTSSADTDSSQESRRRIEYSPPITKSELSKSRSYPGGSLRIPRRSSCLVGPPSGPVKADHSALKECNRRPPTPLTVFPDSHHCVRFDEQLQLSEQNIRRSCRKLFATLYAQRFSYPGHLQQEISRTGSTRLRSRTVPEQELRRYNPFVEGQFRSGKGHKENIGPADGVTSNGQSVQRTVSDCNENALHPQQYRLHMQQRLPTDFSEEGPSHSNSTDSGLGSLRNSGCCTCHERPTSINSSHSNTQYAAYRCCNCGQDSPKAHQSSSPKLFKSNSCSTLSASGAVFCHQSRPQLTQFPPRTLRKMVSSQNADRSPKITKTSSCSNLLERGGFQVTNIPVYNDNMIQVYARIASVIPEDLKSMSGSEGARRSKTLNRQTYRTDNVYDAVWHTSNTLPPPATNTLNTLPPSTMYASNYLPPPMEQTSNTLLPSTTDLEKRSETVRIIGRRLYSNKTDALKTQMSELTTFKPFTRKELVSKESDNQSTHSAEIYSQIPDGPYERKPLRDGTLNRTGFSQRPKSIGVVIPNLGSNPIYLKSALKKPTQKAILHVDDPKPSETEVKTLSEVEYAVVDKSKKNRFASLPALNSNGPTTEIQEKDPPVPPKKRLHKSDFSLYRSRSSSPKKGILERMQTLTKNAKSALQKAFSTERIYRPSEKEERMETKRNQGLQRSRSFIKGLTNSFRRKKRKTRPPMQEVVLAPSPSPEWDDQSLDSNSTMHVRGQLWQLNIDGSQVVELMKPSNKPYGFFVARGRVRNSKGVFVSRMRDQETQKQLAGLLDIGDEILEIDGCNVKDADIMEVNRLMANKNILLLTVLPYICRKDT